MICQFNDCLPLILHPKLRSQWSLRDVLFLLWLHLPPALKGCKPQVGVPRPVQHKVGRFLSHAGNRSRSEQGNLKGKHLQSQGEVSRVKVGYCLCAQTSNSFKDSVQTGDLSVRKKHAREPISMKDFEHRGDGLPPSAARPPSEVSRDDNSCAMSPVAGSHRWCSQS